MMLSLAILVSEYFDCDNYELDFGNSPTGNRVFFCLKDDDLKNDILIVLIEHIENDGPNAGFYHLELRALNFIDENKNEHIMLWKTFHRLRKQELNFKLQRKIISEIQEMIRYIKNEKKGEE